MHKGRNLIQTLERSVDMIINPPTSGELRVDTQIVSPPDSNSVIIPMTRLSDLPAIMQTCGSTAKQNVIQTKCLHWR